jgi:hypothetical protein
MGHEVHRNLRTRPASLKDITEAWNDAGKVQPGASLDLPEEDLLVASIQLPKTLHRNLNACRTAPSNHRRKF